MGPPSPQHQHHSTTLFNLALSCLALLSISAPSSVTTLAEPISSPGALNGIAFDAPFDWATRARVQVEDPDDRGAGGHIIDDAELSRLAAAQNMQPKQNKQKGKKIKVNNLKGGISFNDSAATRQQQQQQQVNRAGGLKKVRRSHYDHMHAQLLKRQGSEAEPAESSPDSSRSCPSGRFTFAVQWSDDSITYLRGQAGSGSPLSATLGDTADIQEASNLSFHHAPLVVAATEGGALSSLSAPCSLLLSANDDDDGGEKAAGNALTFDTHNLHTRGVSPSVFLSPKEFDLYQDAKLPVSQIQCGLQSQEDSSAFEGAETKLALECSYGGVPLDFFKAGQSPFLFLGTNADPRDFPEVPLTAKAVYATRA